MRCIESLQYLSGSVSEYSRWEGERTKGKGRMLVLGGLAFGACSCPAERQMKDEDEHRGADIGACV
jgi:hypothetical protein